MSNVRKLMIFVAAFGLSFVCNAFADEPTVDTQSVTQTTTEVAKDVDGNENKTVTTDVSKTVKEKKVVKKHHHKKHEKKAEQEKEMQDKDLHEKDKQ
jgi:hypothetical protein